ncbi:MAG TPA: hypothetical protein VJX23_08760 [Candidatus Binataceae bacterium]|nr:hypothetical protein [Candidatus Binataceae bacterium]
MKFFPIAVATLLVFGSPRIVVSFAHAGEPIEVDSPAGDDPPSQVLELPQSCTLDGTPIECDNPEPDIDAADSGASAEAASGQTAEQAAGANTGVASAAKSPDSDDTDQTANADWGTMQDYQDQGQVTGPLVSSAVPYGVGTLPNEAYIRPPILVAAPIPIGPFIPAAGPFLGRVIAAPGPIMMPRGRWLYPPRPMGGFTMVRPMPSSGMPRAFRIR